MSGLFWNARRLGQNHKKKFLQEAIFENQLVFVRVQETKKKDFKDDWLNSLTGNDRFVWNWVPSEGQSGGLLLGVNDSFFEVGDCDKGDYHIRMVVYDRKNDFKWNLVIIYGAAHDKDKDKFLVELVHVLGFNRLPIVVGGDFNIIRKVFERNTPKKPSKWTALFNGIIEHWVLQEIELSGRIFTWSNNHDDPLFEKLDRVLVSPEWLKGHFDP